MRPETWKPVAGYEGLYEVSDKGTVRSLPRVSVRGYRLTSKNIATVKNKNDRYLRINLRKNGTASCKLLHRVVAEAFLPNPEHKPEVNHVDGNKQNNQVSNLEWVTPSENQQHAIAMGLRDRILWSKPVAVYTLTGELVRVYQSAAEAHRDTGVSLAAIYNRCLGRTNGPVQGCYWKYANN